MSDGKTTSEDSGHLTQSNGIVYEGNSTVTIRTCPCPNGRWQIVAHPQTSGRVPHKCPVCGGRGTVPRIAYGGGSTYTGEDPCHACGGTGIVWGGV